MKKKCKVSYCTEIVEDGTYCSKHERAKPQRKRRYFESDSFYNSTAWRKVSSQIRRERPLCEFCASEVSDVVDHFYERRMPHGEFYELHDSNLNALCHCCHNKKTADIARTLINEKPTNRTFKWLEENAISSHQLALIKEIKEGIIRSEANNFQHRI